MPLTAPSEKVPALIRTILTDDEEGLLIIQILEEAPNMHQLVKLCMHQLVKLCDDMLEFVNVCGT
jgi:hypothetical protein